MLSDPQRLEISDLDCGTLARAQDDTSEGVDCDAESNTTSEGVHSLRLTLSALALCFSLGVTGVSGRLFDHAREIAEVLRDIF